MKFGRYLAAHQIDEWKRAYIDYRKLKKQIGRAEEELFDIDSGGTGQPGGAGEGLRETAQDDERRADSARRLQRQTSSSAAPEAADGGGGTDAMDGRDLERGSSGHDDDDEVPSPSSVTKPPRTPTPRARNPRSSHNPASSPLPSPGLSSSSHEHVSDTTQNTGRSLVSRQESSKSGDSPELPLTHRLTRRLSEPKGAWSIRGQDGRWRQGLRSNMDLSEVYERIPPQCRRFFTLLDRELERVTAFYADRETEATKRFDQLDAQWKELASASCIRLPLAAHLTLPPLQITRRNSRRSGNANCIPLSSSRRSCRSVRTSPTYPALISSAEHSHIDAASSPTPLTSRTATKGVGDCRASPKPRRSAVTKSMRATQTTKERLASKSSSRSGPRTTRMPEASSSLRVSFASNSSPHTGVSRR